MGFAAGWSRKLVSMNHGKEDARSRYPESIIKLFAVIHAYFLPFRWFEGFTNALTNHVKGLTAGDYISIGRQG